MSLEATRSDAREIESSGGIPRDGVVTVNLPPQSSPFRLVALWLAGMDLRVTLLAVPPLLPVIRGDLGLDEKGVALLSSLPVLLLAFAAVPGSLLVGRVGALRVLLVGLSTIAVASALRGVGGNAPVLFAMTFAMGVGIAISQPAMPVLVRQWFPSNVARATGLWSNGLLVGEMLGAALPLLVLYSIGRGSWPAVLGLFALPVIATVLFLAASWRRLAAASAQFRGNGWPDWGQLRTWQLGLLQSSAALVYFGSNTFLPDYLHSHDHLALVGPALTLLNLSQVPASLVFGLMPRHVSAHPRVVLLLGILIMAGVFPLLSEHPWVILATVTLLGFTSAYVLVVVLALPALFAPADGVARLAAGAATIGYTTAFLSNLVAGALWDATHIPAFGFLPIVAGATIVLVLGPRLVGGRVAAPGTAP